MRTYEKIKLVELDYKTGKFKAKNSMTFVKEENTVIASNPFGKSNYEFYKLSDENTEGFYYTIRDLHGENVIVKQYYKPNITKTKDWLFVRPVKDTYYLANKYYSVEKPQAMTLSKEQFKEIKEYVFDKNISYK